MSVSISDIEDYISNTYHRTFDRAYLTYCRMFSIADRNKKNLDYHHIVPRCCKGRNDETNLIAVTKEHHTKLHNLILKSDLNDNERRNLEYAYRKRKGKL